MILRAKGLHSGFLQKARVKEITVVTGDVVDVVFMDGLSVLYPNVASAAKHVFNSDIVTLGMEMGVAVALERQNILVLEEA